MPTSGYGRDSHNMRRQGVGIRPPAMADPVEFEVWDLTGGVRTDKTPREIPPNSTPFCEGVRFEGTSLRPEFGLTTVGDPSTYKVLGLADHKYIRLNTLYHRIMRIVRDSNGMAQVESWTGSEWIVAATSSLPINEVMLSVVSTQNQLVFADGDHIYKWEEPNPQSITVEEDFPAGNLIYWPAGNPPQYLYTQITTERNYDHPPWVVYFDVVLGFRYSNDPNAPPDSEHTVSADIQFYAGGILKKTVPFSGKFSPNGTSLPQSISFNNQSTSFEGLGSGGVTQIKVQVANLAIDNNSYVYSWNVNLHVHNKVDDGDPTSGLYYVVDDDPGGTISELSQYAPAATYIFPFGDRLIALQGEGNPQLFSVSADANIGLWWGDPTNPDNLDTVQASLLDSVGDALDDLMACGFVAGNRAALIRRRTIMQISETGVVDIPISAQHWIEGIGTESPHSVVQARDGICFLGHNLMVYYFDGTGPPVAIGVPIHEILRRTLTSNQHLVDATYDPIYDEYIMGVPEGGSSTITRLWICSLGLALDKQELKWRSRLQSVERLATVSKL